MENPGKGQKKVDSSQSQPSFEIKIPLSVFSDRSLPPLEAVVVYLKDKIRLSYRNIAELLNRDERTIWTVYNRAQKKKRKHE